MDLVSLEKSLIQIERYCHEQKYKGYSLYDSHNSIIPFEKFGHTISFLSNQVFKRSPINLRKIFGVRKSINPKGMGLLLHSYSLIMKHNLIEIEGINNITKEIFEWLYNNQSKGYSGSCWGYNYDWPRSDGSMFHAYTPSVVVTAFISRGLMAYYDVSNEPRVKELIDSAIQFVKKDIHCTQLKNSRCYSYTPVQRDLVVNASLLAAEIFAYSDQLNKKSEYKEIVKEVVNYTIDMQNEDGSWYYSHSVKNNQPKDQIDFHQGYVVDSLDILNNIYLFNRTDLNEAIKNGVAYYREKQFHPDGYCYWRIPKIWPVDIHNQSQGIITHARFNSLDPDHLSFAHQIWKWTNKNMRANKGHYYYQKYAFFTNKTNYFRWAQCWMFLAHTKLLIALKQKA